ncbi:hypothetical protein DW783_09320 [Phocaeicola vulgatus]|uniref:Uncharacterized protein n=7 Tax=Bacteroidales TaxID=171549 RepID=A0A412YMT4_9BACE|nr:hypothetical protein DWW09_02860 [Bacteroides clarus]RHD80549.1 hypothetical protein DW783_09320 [Phocaeicola vulgatus]
MLKHSSIFHPRMALSVGLHQKNTFCSFRRYSWGGDKLARVTTGWKGLKPLPKAPVIQYLFFLKEKENRIEKSEFVNRWL